MAPVLTGNLTKESLNASTLMGSSPNRDHAITTVARREDPWAWDSKYDVGLCVGE